MKINLGVKLPISHRRARIYVLSIFLTILATEGRERKYLSRLDHLNGAEKIQTAWEEETQKIGKAFNKACESYKKDHPDFFEVDPFFKETVLPQTVRPDAPE